MSLCRPRLAVVVGMVLAAVATGCDTGAVLASKQTHSSGATAVPVTPEYSARRLGGTETVTLRDLRGKPVLLTSWATWCTECRTELPAIQQLAEAYHDRGLQVIGVNVDEGGDAGPLAFSAQRGLTFPMVHDQRTQYQAAFRAVGVPQTELISADSRLIKTWQGVFDPTDRDNTRLIESSVTSGAPPPAESTNSPAEPSTGTR
jgi:peroxiredoxin